MDVRVGTAAKKIDEDVTGVRNDEGKKMGLVPSWGTHGCRRKWRFRGGGRPSSGGEIGRPWGTIRVGVRGK